MSSNLLPNFGRRNWVAASLLPVTQALLASCAPTPATQEETKTVSISNLSEEDSRKVWRHLNTAVYTPSTTQSNLNILEFIWSQSCGDTMRAYRDHIVPFARRAKNNTAILMHLIARSRLDIGPCKSIRAVNNDSYSAAVIAILKAGAAKGNFLTEYEVDNVLAGFPKLDGYLPDFSENCIKAAQIEALSKGVKTTPTLVMNGSIIDTKDLGRY